MDTGLLVGGLVCLAGLGAVGAGVASATAERNRSVVDYLESLDHEGSADIGPAPSLFETRLAQPFVDRVLGPMAARVVGWASTLAPADHRARVRARLAAAGLDLQRRPEEIIAVEGIGALVGAAMSVALWATGVLTPLLALLAAVTLALVGASAPLVWLSHRVDARVHAIRADLPDLLDLLAISVEAGVGLEGAIEVVTDRFDSPLAEELSRVLQEMELGLSRRDALGNLKHRAGVPEVSTFVGALIQADALGMPLGHVLKIQAGEMRTKRRQWARARAAKLPVKILFPLAMCIFPAVLVVVLGPAISQIGQALR